MRNIKDFYKKISLQLFDLKNSIRQVLKFILTIRNEKEYKVISIFNFKIKFRSNSALLKYLYRKNGDYELYINQLKYIIDSSCDITKCKQATGTLRKAQMVRFESLKFVIKIFEQYNITYWLDGGTCLGAYRHQGFIPWDDDVDIVVPRPDYQRAIDILNEVLKNTDISAVVGGFNDKGDGCSQVARLKDIKTNFNYLDIFVYDYSNNSTISKKELLKKLQKIKSEIYTNAFTKKLYQEKRSIMEYLPLVFKKYEDYGVVIPNAENCYVFRGVDSMSHQQKQTIHRVEDIFPLQKVQFENIVANAPNNMEQFLKNINEGAYGNIMDFPPLGAMSIHISNDVGYAKQLHIQFEKINNILVKYKDS